MATHINYQTSTLTLSNAGAKVYVPYSTTDSDWLMFQTSTTNSASNICVVPNGTANTSYLQLVASSSETDCSYLNLSVEGGTALINSTGTGTFTPAKLRFNMDPNAYPALTVGTNGKVGIGLQDQSVNADYALNICSGANLGLTVGDVQLISKYMCGVDNGTSYSVNNDSRMKFDIRQQRMATIAGGLSGWSSQATTFATTVDTYNPQIIRLNGDTNGTMYFITANGGPAHVFFAYQPSTAFANVGPHFVTARSNNSAWNGMVVASNVAGAGDTEFYVRGDGNVFADGNYVGGGADYAEMFEWEDGNPTNEDRRGISVVTVGEYIKPATELDDPNSIIGIVSAASTSKGDDPIKWKNKYLRDDYGKEIRDVNGDRVPNPEFDPEQEYVMRSERKEWGCVGLVGKVFVRKGQPVNPYWRKISTGVDTKPDLYLVR